MIIIAINNSSGINSSELQRKEQTFVKRNEGRWTGCETDHWMKKCKLPLDSKDPSSKKGSSNCHQSVFNHV